MSRQEFDRVIGKCVILKFYKNFDKYYDCMLNEGNKEIHKKRKEINTEIYIKTRNFKNLNINIFIFLLGKYV